jgi:hypothetical protein
MHLFPRSFAEWTRSIAYPVFGCCCLLLLYSLSAGFGNDRVWHYAGPAIAGQLLPALGALLGVTTLLGTGLHFGFRRAAFIVALLSVLGCLMPALAE